MKNLLLIFLILISTSLAYSQEKFTLNGYVKDFDNGEELIGVTVLVKEINNGVITNVYGFYSITLPAGKYTVIYSYVGYNNVVYEVELDQNIERNIELTPASIQLQEVVVSDEAPDKNVSDVSMSRNEVDISQVKKLPALLGESDLLKTVQMLPGVVTAGEGTSAYFVRGGSADQNLILIDEAPIYDPSHLFGLFSVFNADAIKDSELYKGGIPARYGGRLSSILDVRTKDGNNKRLQGSGGIGWLASRFQLEGPIQKEKSSFLLSARRSYVDLFLAAAGEDNRAFFYDVNAKVNWKHQNNNRFFLAAYLGRDAFRSGDDFGFDWGNKTTTFRWNHLFNERLFSNTTFIASQFDFGLEFIDPVQGFDWTARIQQLSFKEDLTYFLTPKNEVNFGYHVSWQKFSPGKIEPTVEGSIFVTTDLQRLFALDHAFYLSNKQTVSDRLTLEYGVRLSVFQNIGKSTIFTYEDQQDNTNTNVIGSTAYNSFETIKTFVNPEPRFGAKYTLTPTSSIKVSYNRMAQNVHLVSSGTVPLPFNTWQPSSPYLDSQLADQVAIGYFRNFKDNAYEFSVEAYYKDMDNVTDFADNADIFFNEHLATEFRQGSSEAYGLELFLKKNEGKVTGFAAYTLAKAERTVPGVNLGQPFDANYDRRHNISLVGTYNHSKRWDFGMNFVYNTGRPTTIPSGRYEYQNYNVDFITERNGYRLPDFHRLDLSATLTPLKNEGRKWKTSWVFSIYNVYNRKNPFTLFTEEGDQPGEKTAKMVYLFPILPSVTYNFRF